jgi:hypothetical protein
LAVNPPTPERLIRDGIDAHRDPNLSLPSFGVLAVNPPTPERLIRDGIDAHREPQSLSPLLAFWRFGG